MTIVVTVLFVTAFWIFLAAVLGGCGGTASPRGHGDNVFGGELWLWKRRDGGVGGRGVVPDVGRPEPVRSRRPAIPSPTA